MDDEEGGIRQIGRWACCCPAGAWPSCGMRRQCGDYEQVARRQGMSVIEVEGLTKPFAVTAAGTAPVLMLPTWSRGPVREYICSWLINEVYRRTFGQRAVDCAVGRAVRANLDTEREAV